jgi:radical SAM-linked protein
MIYRPVRERDPEQIVDTVISAIDKGGFDEASLTTLSTADYSCISPLMSTLMKKLKEKKVALSVASLRAYGLDENTLDEMASYRAQGLTFAPEAGTQRMRDVVNKNVTEEDLERTAHRVFSRGWQRMKLYFMIGLPTEEDEDVAGIMETGARMKEIGRTHHGGKAGVTVSVSSHVPKPHTPFQWVAMDALEEIERKQDLLQDIARRHRLEFRRHDPRTSFLEGVLGRGDRRVAQVIELAWRKGCRFDGWEEHLDWDAWVDALDESGIDPQLYLGTIALDARTPWDHLDMQLEERFLQTDYKRAMRSKLSPPCGKPAGAQVHHSNIEEHDADQGRLVCYHCGVACDLDGMRTERRTFLTKLGAFGKADREAARVAARRAREEKQQRIARGGAAHDLGQGEGVRVRLSLTKTGADAMTSHLDLVRKIPRIFRRAGIEVFYTEGYHPKPTISFGPALALGVESACELLEVKLVERPDPADLLRRLNEKAESGLRFTACRIVEPGERRMTALMQQADYLVKLDRFEPGLAERIVEEFERDRRRLVSVQRKKAEKQVALDAVVAHLRLADARDRADLPEALASALPSRLLALGLRLDGSAQLKPEEVLRALLGPEFVLAPVDLVRLGIWYGDGADRSSPLEFHAGNPAPALS